MEVLGCIIDFVENRIADSTIYFFVIIFKLILKQFVKQFFTLKEICSRRSILNFSPIAEDLLDLNRLK